MFSICNNISIWKYSMKKTLSLFFMIVFMFALWGCEHQHKYSERVVDPTCEEKGYTEFTCECGETYKDNFVEAKGHNFGEWTVLKEPTEEETVLKERVCECGEKETEEIEKLTHVHNYTEKVVEATCKEEGYTEYTCECGDTYKDNYVEKIDRVFGEWVIVEEPTEEKQGYVKEYALVEIFMKIIL